MQPDARLHCHQAPAGPARVWPRRVGHVPQLPPPGHHLPQRLARDAGATAQRPARDAATCRGSKFMEAVLARTAAPPEVEAVLARTAATPIRAIRDTLTTDDDELLVTLDQDEAVLLADIAADDVVPQFPSRSLTRHHLLGEGTFGLVTLVTMPGGSEAALKEPKVPESGSDTDGSGGSSIYVRMEQVGFLHEVRNAMLLARAGQFPLHAVVLDDARIPCGYIMEYCPGGALDELVWSRRKRMTAREVIGILHRTAECVASMHEAFPAGMHWAHRDVKPGNFLLRSATPDPHAPLLLADLGMAGSFSRMLGSWVGWSVRGTPGFAPYELKEGGVGCEKADVYSLGITFLWILDPKLQLHAGYTPMFAPSLPLPHDVSQQLEELILNMTAPFPYMRPDSRAVERKLADMVALVQ